MKIEFESREEIQRLAAVLQDHVFPAPIIVEPSELLDTCGGNTDRPLPWNADGFHIPFTIIGNNTERLYTHEEIFGRGVVWEEVEQDGKKFLRRVISGDTPFMREEDMIYLAGQLDAYFQLIGVGCNTMGDVAKITGQMEPLLVDLCRIWSRRMSGGKLGRKWFHVEPNGSYTITDDPEKWPMEGI